MISAVQCISCGANLCRNNQRIRELPSRDWMELLDCWSCHNDEFASITNKLSLSAQGDILPRKGDAHYGGGFWLLINVDEWHLTSISYSSAEREVKSVVKCSACDTPLGHLINETHAKIEVTKLDNFIHSNNYIVDKKISLLILMREVEQIMEIHGGRCIRLVSTSSLSPINLQIISPRTWISTDLAEWSPAMVLRVFDADEDEKDSLSFPTVQLPEEILRRLVESIRGSSREAARIANYPNNYSIISKF